MPSSCILALALPGSAFAQTAQTAQNSTALPSKDSKEELEKLQKALEGKPLKLLESTMADAQGLKLAENQALFKCTGADLLWTRDEKRARSLFQDAVNALTTAMNTSKVDSMGNNNFWILVQSRYQTIHMIANRDPQFALDLLRSSHPVLPEGLDFGYAGHDPELMLEQSIAVKAAEKDPKLALKLARESLKKGVTANLLSLLRRLQEKDGEAAKQLAADIVSKVKTEDFAVNEEAGSTATELLRAALRPQQDNFPAQIGNAKVKPLVMDDETIRDLIEVVVSGALSTANQNPSALVQIQSLLPEIEKRVPARISQLRQRMAELIQASDPRTRTWMQYEPLMQNGSAEELLAAVADAPPQMRRDLQMMAIGKLSQKGDVERARQIAQDNLSGAEREQVLAGIDRQALGSAIKQQKIDEAKQIISRMGSREARAGAFAELAAAIVMTQGERKLALDLLDESRKLITNPPVNQKQIDALIKVVGAYAVVEPARAFELINPLIVQANEMIAAAALLAKFGSGQGLFKQDEMLLQHSFMAANGAYVHQLKKLTSLARADFDRTKMAVDGFQREEIRLMGRLLIAQSVLSDRLDDTNQGQVLFGAGILWH